MQKFDLVDNTTDQYIIIEPKRQQVGFYPDEESQAFATRRKEFIASEGADPTTNTEFRRDTALNASNNGGPFVAPFASAISGTDYRGAQSLSLPVNIDPTFTNFLLLDTVTNNFNTLDGATTIGEFNENLYSEEDGGPTLVQMMHGVQAFRIPINRFNTILTDPEEIEENNGNDIQENTGKYYIQVSPQYIETTITQVRFGNRIDWDNLQEEYDELSGWDRRRTSITAPNDDFRNTIWNFEEFEVQRGRLYGSIVEIWESDLSRMKQQKIIAENSFNFVTPAANGSADEANLILSPDILGYEAPNDEPVAGDIIRIFPRETSFDNIYIEVNYIGSQPTLQTLVQFMQNDVVRNLNTGVFEIYDKNGVQIDSDGNLSGNVTQSYQISKEGNFEVRRNLNL